MTPRFLTRDETRTLIAQAQAGDTAAEETILAVNAGLVHKGARHYAKFCETWDLDDLLQEARLGIIDAIRKFDLTRETAFSTYAIHCIRGRVTRALRADPKIPSPEHWRTQYHENEDGTYTTRSGRIYSRVSCVSIDDKVHNTQGGRGQQDVRLGDIIPAPDDPAAEALEPIHAEEQRAELEQLMACLRPTEAEAIRLYYGFDIGEQRTLDEVAQLQGIVREGVRQRLKRALFALRWTVRNGGGEVGPRPRGGNRIGSIDPEPVIELWKEGLTHQQIGDHLGCSRPAVTNILRSHRRDTGEVL